MPHFSPTDLRQDGRASPCSLHDFDSLPASHLPSSSFPTSSWPVHPVPCLREAFEESISDFMDRNQQQAVGAGADPDTRVRKTLDAATRRLQLLELDSSDDLFANFSSRWRQKPGAKFHPLWKIVAQISFGVHLLHQGTAKSTDEVVRILEAHVKEVDSFLEQTTADFDLAISDIEERTQLLLLPLTHSHTFNKMLREKDFRTSILDGNDIIERIISRTNRAMNSSMQDVKKGTEATAELAKFLDRIGESWTHHDFQMQSVYQAMVGNAEGWYECFDKFERKSDKLISLLVRLEEIVGDVNRRVARASRKNAHQHHRSYSSGSKLSRASSALTRSAYPDQHPSLNKPLPPDPLHRALAASAVARPVSPEAGPDGIPQPPAELPASSQQDLPAESVQLSSNDTEAELDSEPVQQPDYAHESPTDSSAPSVDELLQELAPETMLQGAEPEREEDSEEQSQDDGVLLPFAIDVESIKTASSEGDSIRKRRNASARRYPSLSLLDNYSDSRCSSRVTSRRDSLDDLCPALTRSNATSSISSEPRSLPSSFDDSHISESTIADSESTKQAPPKLSLAVRPALRLSTSRTDFAALDVALTGRRSLESLSDVHPALREDFASRKSLLSGAASSSSHTSRTSVSSSAPAAARPVWSPVAARRGQTVPNVSTQVQIVESSSESGVTVEDKTDVHDTECGPFELPASEWIPPARKVETNTSFFISAQNSPITPRTPWTPKTPTSPRRYKLIPEIDSIALDAEVALQTATALPLWSPPVEAHESKPSQHLKKRSMSFKGKLFKRSSTLRHGGMGGNVAVF